MRAMDIIERLWMSRNSDEETLRCFSKRVLESERLTLGNGFEDAIKLIMNLSEIENSEEFYDTVDIVERNLLGMYSDEDYDIIAQFFGYIELLKCNEDFKEIKAFIRTAYVFMNQINEMYKEINKKDEENEMNDNNEKYLEEKEIITRTIQNAVTQTELAALMLQLDSLSVLDESSQRLFVEQYCKTASSIDGAKIPTESDDMRMSFMAIVSCINDLVNETEENFRDALFKADQNIRNLDYLDEDDIKAIDCAFPYIYMVYEKDGIERAKRLIKTIKLYLSIVYDFIKNNVEQ